MLVTSRDAQEVRNSGKRNNLGRVAYVSSELHTHAQQFSKQINLDACIYAVNLRTQLNVYVYI